MQGGSMHSHTVFFWLNDDLSLDAISDFEMGLESLTKIPLVKQGYFGKPANTHRSIVDRSYSYGLTLHFTSIIEHDLYQSYPSHQDFVANHSGKWKRVLIYDLETSENK
jgi:hypothetical protein